MQCPKMAKNYALNFECLYPLFSKFNFFIGFTSHKAATTGMELQERRR